MNYKLFLLLMISVKSIFCSWRSEGLTLEERIQLAIFTERRAAQIVKDIRRRCSSRTKNPVTNKQLAEEKRVYSARSAQNKIVTVQQQAASVARLSMPKNRQI